MTSKRTDQILLAAGLCLILISSYQLFLSRLVQNKGLVLGTLEHTEAVVKIKNALSLDWRDGHTGGDVNEEQLIYTDESSSAQVKFTEGHKITISENSLVRIASLGDSGGVNVQKGLIRAKIQGNKPLVINVNGSEMTLKGEDAEVQISLDGKEGEIGVLDGEVSVENLGQIEKLNKSSALKVNNGTLVKHQIYFSLLEPGLSEALYTIDSSETINFKWEPALFGVVKISSDSSFKKSKTVEGDGSASIELDPGHYFWKVQSTNGTSLIGQFNLVKELPLELLRPLNGEIISLPRDSSSTPQVFLQWKGEQGQEYLVEWVDQKEYSKKIQASGLIVPLNESGSLRWRVKPASVKRPLAVWSEWQYLEVNLIDPPFVPTNLLPEELELQTYSQEETEVKLSWNSSSKSEFELIEPKNKSSVKEVSEKSLILKVKVPGTYRWRIRGKDEFNRVSEWSDWKIFTLEDLSHEVSTEGFQRIQLKKPDQSVTFNWEASDGGGTIFELAESKEFSEIIIKKEVSGEEVKVVIPKIGNYYWRSRQVRADGTFSVSEPKKVIIEPAPAPVKPEKLPDLEVPIEWLETYYRPRWWHFFISEAYADEFMGVAKINLPINEDAKQYVIKIYQDAEGENLLLEKIVESPVIEWKDAKPGQYYWQYALIDYWGRQSPFSDLSSLSVVGNEPILPEKPRLLSPIRAVEIDGPDIEIKWSFSDKNTTYRFDLSRSDDFKRILIQKNVSDNQLELEKPKLVPGLYFWRITATNESNKQVVSNTGRFIVKPAIERTAIVDFPEALIKRYGTRFSFSWAPSLDTYKFESGDSEGTIDGNAINSFDMRALYFSKNFIFSADLLRQSGKVFEEEKYLFQRLQIHGTWKFKNGNHLWGPGVTAGTVSGFSYDISNEVARGSSVSGPIYGPHLEGFYTVSPTWELQVKVSYMLGEIPHVEIVSEVNFHVKNYFAVFGLGYSIRDYKESDGVQSSVRLNLGLGKEF